jgi:hypothetical protein
MQRRDGPPNLNNINDTRNGLLLYRSLYKVFGLGEVAFLKVMTFIITNANVHCRGLLTDIEFYLVG